MNNSKQVVSNGYDQIAERYRAWAGADLRGPRAHALAPIWDRVPAGAPVLELGCATGEPVTRALAGRVQGEIAALRRRGEGVT